MATIAADYSEQLGSRNTERVSTQEHSNQKRNALHSREGRIGVLSHAARVLLATVIIAVTTTPFMILAVITPESAETTKGMVSMAAAGILLFVGLCYGLWLSVISSMKRLHDLNKSGWFYLVCIIPIAGTFFYLYLSLKRADDGDNKFGKSISPTSLEKRAGFIGLVFLLLFAALGLVGSIFDLKNAVGV